MYAKPQFKHETMHCNMSVDIINSDSSWQLETLFRNFLGQLASWKNKRQVHWRLLKLPLKKMDGWNVVGGIPCVIFAKTCTKETVSNQQLAKNKPLTSGRS